MTGNELRRRRIDLGLRQWELAELAGVSERFIRSLEHDKDSVQLDHVRAVLEVLGMELRLHIRGTG